jgi:hypothetical protein
MSFTTPKVSSTAFSIGVMAFVVKAAEKISISSDCIRFGLHHEQYLVLLYLEQSIILYALLKCLLNASLVVKAPVSITKAYSVSSIINFFRRFAVIT